MTLFFDLLISLAFSVHSSFDLRSYNDINRSTYNVFNEKTRKAILLAMSILNYTFLAVLGVMAVVEIGSQIDFDGIARSISIIQILANIMVYVSVIPISYFKRKMIVRELCREFEYNHTYTFNELYEYVREHIVITEKELTRMLRSIKSMP